jgi:hypothetical protein
MAEVVIFGAARAYPSRVSSAITSMSRIVYCGWCGAAVKHRDAIWGEVPGGISSGYIGPSGHVIYTGGGYCHRTVHFQMGWICPACEREAREDQRRRDIKYKYVDTHNKIGLTVLATMGAMILAWAVFCMAFGIVASVWRAG